MHYETAGLQYCIVTQKPDIYKDADMHGGSLSLLTVAEHDCVIIYCICLSGDENCSIVKPGNMTLNWLAATAGLAAAILQLLQKRDPAVSLYLPRFESCYSH